MAFFPSFYIYLFYVTHADKKFDKFIKPQKQAKLTKYTLWGDFLKQKKMSWQIYVDFIQRNVFIMH